MGSNIQQSPGPDQLHFAFEFVTKHKELPNTEALKTARDQIPNLQLPSRQEAEDFTIEVAAAEVLEGYRELAKTVGNFFGWGGTAENKSAKALSQDEIRQQLGALVQEERTLVNRREAINQTIKEIVQEMEVKQNDGEFNTYFSQAVRLLKEKQIEFLQFQVDLLKNFKKQENLIKLYDSNIVLPQGDWDQQTQGLSALIEGLHQELKQLDTQEPSTIEWLQDLLAQMKEQWAQSAWTEIKASLGQLLGNSGSLKQVAEKQETYQTLLKEIEEQGLTDERLVLLESTTRELNTLTGNFESEKEELQQSIVDQLKTLYRNHPTIAKTVTLTMATVIGTAAGGFAGGFACKIAVEKLMAELQPCCNVETRSERIGSAIFQTVASLFAGGSTAAAAAGSSALIEEAAPEEVKKVVEAGAFAMVAGNLGLSIPASLGIGMGATLFFRNLRIIDKIKRDLFSAKEAVTSTPLQAPIKFLKWSIVETTSFANSVVNAAVGGRKCEVITKLATVAFSAIAIHFTLWTLPLSLGLLYLSSRAFELKYEGPANLNNKQFRAFVVQEVATKGSGLRIDRLKAVLLTENEEFQLFAKRLEHLALLSKEDLVTDPVAV